MRTKKKILWKTSWYKTKKKKYNEREDRILQEDIEEGKNQVCTYFLEM